MKLPNGYGSITKLSGKRRNPWRVRKTSGWEIDPKTQKLKQNYITIGYYETKAEALSALVAYNENPYDLNSAKITLAEIYEKWSADKYGEISESNVKGYKAAWKLCSPIASMKMVDIKIDHIQKVADDSGKNKPTLKKFKTLMNELFKYAVIHDIISKEKNMVEFLNISKAGNPNALNRSPFTTKEIKKLWEIVDTNEYFTVVLMLIYSGVRISEMLDLKKENINIEEQYFNVVASKTEAGVRTVPIADKVLPFFKHWYYKNNSEYLLSTPEGNHFEYRNYYDSYWTPLMNTVNISHTPHDTRHTCVSLLTAAKVDERFIQKIVGHKGQGVTRQVYTHLEIKDLLLEINKI